VLSFLHTETQSTRVTSLHYIVSKVNYFHYIVSKLPYFLHTETELHMAYFWV
jgi:hypothetical protein